MIFPVQVCVFNKFVFNKAVREAITTVKKNQKKKQSFYYALNLKWWIVTKCFLFEVDVNQQILGRKCFHERSLLGPESYWLKIK